MKEDAMTEAKHGETPRTDAHLRERYGEHTLVYVKRRYEKMECASEFARQLERELTEVRGENEVLREQNFEMNKALADKAAEKMPHSFVNMRWACGHEGGAACLQCYRQALRDLEAARRERDRYKEALEWVKRDCEVCNWHCDNCGRDYGMTETDLYAETSRALSQPTPQAGEEHVPTDMCGFDRNSSISEDRYVCDCGWRSSK
jgi:hypothetical protein